VTPDTVAALLDNYRHLEVPAALPKYQAEIPAVSVCERNCSTSPNFALAVEQDLADGTLISSLVCPSLKQHTVKFG
jgi:hypothetical protein